jgi:predicted membrane protein
MVRETCILALVMGFLLVLTVLAASHLEQSEALAQQTIVRVVAALVVGEPVAEEE